MTDSLADIIRALPDEAFQESAAHSLASMTPLQRLRWLQQTAHFIWKHRGAAANGPNDRSAHCGQQPHRSDPTS